MSSDDQQDAPLSAEHARLAEGSAAAAGGDWKLIGHIRRPRMGHRARGLQRRRRRLALLSLRSTPTRAPTAGARTAWRASAIVSSASVSRSRSWNGRDPILKERIFGLAGRRAITARTPRNTGGLSTRRRPTPGYVGVITIHKPNFRMRACGRRTPTAHATSRNSSFSTLACSTAIDIGKSLRITPRWHRMMS